MNSPDNIRINVIVDKELRKEVRLKAMSQGKTVTQVIVKLLEKWVKK